jgi:hypothetical protein
MTTFRRLPVTILAASALFAVAAAPAADAKAKLRLGVYDCQSYNYSTGFLDYQGSVKLKRRHKYESSYGRKGSRLTKPNKGKWVIKGSRIKFRTGAYKKTPGKIYPKDENHKFAYFALYVDGKPSGVSCYYVPGT